MSNGPESYEEMAERVGEQKPAPTMRWGIIEIYGHRTVAGIMTGDPPYLAGISIEIPTKDGNFLREWYGEKAIFSAREVPEDVARRAAAQSWHVQNATQALLPAPKDEYPGPGIAADRLPLYGEIDALVDNKVQEMDILGPPADGAICGTARAAREAPDGDEKREKLIELAALTIATVVHLDQEQAEQDVAEITDTEGDGLW